MMEEEKDENLDNLEEKKDNQEENDEILED